MPGRARKLGRKREAVHRAEHGDVDVRVLAVVTPRTGPEEERHFDVRAPGEDAGRSVEYERVAIPKG